MPIGVGVRGFFETTLESWEKGVTTLQGPPPEGEVTDRGPFLRPGPGAPTTVALPGMWDIVKVGAPDPTAPETKANNRAIAQAIRNSPEPEYAQAFGEIMTAIDNVRDVLALGMIAGRITLAVTGAAEVLAAGGTIVLTSAEAEFIAVAAARPFLAIGLGELAGVGAATAAGSVILPVLAVVTAGFFIAEIAHWMAALAIPGYALLCHGPVEAAFAAIPALVWGRGLKANVSKLSRANPWAIAQEVREVRAGNVATFVGREYIEAGRATAVLGARGWLLGGIVGTLTAGAFAGQRILNGDRVNFDGTRFTQSITRPASAAEQRIGGTLPTYQAAVAAKIGRSPIPGSNIALRAAQTAAECLWSLPGLLRVVDRMRPIDLVQVLCANLVALDILQPYLYGRGWQGLAADLAEEGVPPPPVWNPLTRDLLRELGSDYVAHPTWPMPGAPAKLLINAISSDYVAEMDAKLQAWFLKYNGWLEAGLCGVLLDSIVQRLYFIITESDDGLRASAVGYWKVLFALAEGNRQVLVTYPEATVTAFFDAALASMTRQGRNMLTGPELDQVAATVGMRLLVIEPPQVTPPHTVAA